MAGKEEGSESGRSSDWAELTHECLINILSRLTIKDRWVGAMLVCKSWIQSCKDPFLNSVFDLEPYFDIATELPRWWTLEFERKIDFMLRSVVEWSGGSLTEIRVRHCSDWSLSLVAERCPNLERLSIQSCPKVTDESMAKIATKCPNLTELDISYSYEISYKSVSAVGENCPNLKILKWNLMNWLDPSQYSGVVPKEYQNSIPQNGDSDADAIAKFMPRLLHLELRFSKLTLKGLASICEGCPNLEYLDISGCANLRSRDVASAAVGLKNLKTFRKPSFYIPRSAFQAERYGHWRLYDERFQTDSFRI